MLANQLNFIVCIYYDVIFYDKDTLININWLAAIKYK